MLEGSNYSLLPLKETGHTNKILCIALLGQANECFTLLTMVKSQLQGQWAMYILLMFSIVVIKVWTKVEQSYSDDVELYQIVFVDHQYHFVTQKCIISYMTSFAFSGR